MGKQESPIRLAKQVLLGTVFGDGSLDWVKTTTKARLHLAHSDMQFEYLLWKMSMLQPLVGSFTVHRRYGGSYSKTSTFFVRTLSSEYLKYIYDDFYFTRNEKTCKEVHQNVLNRLTPLSIAVWYMDGCLVKAKNKTEPWSVRLCTQGFLYTEQELIVDYFMRKWDIQFHILKDENQQFFLDSGKESCLKFLKLVQPHVYETMKYKIDIFTQKTKHPVSDGDVLRALQECKELVRNDQPAVYFL
jgi:hypothetical protein